ncbi:MAG TPA: peptide ABC transporter substrate-binding protein [Candidatus Acidoferrales bacterium]|nr:peptide ABC transporter substrate-binding protein [Candidatus Acidoferrales bacterium]
MSSAASRRGQALVLVALLCGCTRVGVNTEHATAGRHPWTIAGVLRIADTRQPDNLNPMLSFGQMATDLSMFWGAYLFRWDDRSELVPELAMEVPTPRNGGISADGLTVTYHLRHGVRWQDGAPFGADDVIYSWSQVLNPRNDVQSRVGYDAVDSIEKLDDYTLRVHLRRRFAPFVETFFAPADATYAILPKHLLSQYAELNDVAYNNLPVGTGPFRVVSDEKDVEIRMLANPSYWRGPPRLKEIIFKIIPSDDTILTQFRTHEIDMRIAAPATQIAALAGEPGLRMYDIPFTSFESLDFNTEHAVVSDPRVRRALHYAIDVERMGRALTHGLYLQAGADQPPFLWAYDPRVRRYPYDPRRAAALFDAAGWKMGPDGVRVKDGNRLALTLVSATGAALGSAVDVLVQRDWREVGVDVEIKQYPTDVLGGPDGIYRTGNFDVFFDSWSNGVDPDDSQIFMCDERPPWGSNYFRYCDPALDRAEDAALTHYDRNNRQLAYGRIQEILAEDDPIIVLWFDIRQDVANSDLHGYRPAHAVTTFWNPWQWSI